jgi:hypothetical protein
MDDFAAFHNFAKTVATAAAAAAAIATVFTAYFIYKRDYEDLPSKVAKLEQKVDSLSSPSKSALEWVGVWHGKWNDTWKVEFTIYYTYNSTYLLAYSWEEHVGDPMTESINLGTAQGEIMTWGDELYIRKTSATRAVATGVFIKGKAVTALLSKVQ